MKKMNKAFTLTELLVALGVIGILCAILLPVISNLMPNQNTMMAKRAYYTVQTIVAELLNDESCYPDKTALPTNAKIGFDDGEGTPNCIKWDDSKGNSPENKFKTLFLDKLGKELSDIDSNGKFTTSDGMIWAFTNVSFSAPTTSDGKLVGDGGSIKLTIDVNGSDKPNCGHKGESYNTQLGNGGNCENRENGFDRFQMTIKGNGQIDINKNDVWAINAVKVNRNITSEKNSNEEDEGNTEK